MTSHSTDSYRQSVSTERSHKPHPRCSCAPQGTTDKLATKSNKRVSLADRRAASSLASHPHTQFLDEHAGRTVRLDGMPRRTGTSPYVEILVEILATGWGFRLKS